MRKLTIFAAGIIVTATVLLSTGAMAAESKNERPDAAEQVILRLLYQPTKKAIEDYYGELKQYWEQEVINIQKNQSRHTGRLLYRRKLFMAPTIRHTVLKQ